MNLKKTLSILIAAVLLFTVMAPAASAVTPAEAAHLQFRDDGTFRILNFSDIQDDEILSLNAKQFIRDTVKENQPDMIVLTGDNIAGYRSNTKWEARTAIRQYMNLFERLGVPVAMVFGNHDNENTVLTKEEHDSLTRGARSACRMSDALKSVLKAHKELDDIIDAALSGDDAWPDGAGN